MTRREDGRWVQSMTITRRDGTKVKKYFYGASKAEVLRKIREYEEETANGETFETVADEWWEEHSEQIAFNTQHSYKPAMERAIDHFGKQYIKNITPVQISMFIKDFSKGHARKTVRTQLGVINLIFKYAVENGYAPFNPSRDLSIPSNLPSTKRTSPPSEDIARVKQSIDLPFGLFAYMAMYTGLRRGELLALEWKDIDYEKRTITVNKSVYHQGNSAKVKLPKTKTSIGVVPILDALQKVLPKKKPKGLVFPNSASEYMTESQVRHAWERYRKDSGISSTPHQFRHAYATMLYEAGIPPEEMQALLRHAQLSTTMDIYRDIRDSKVKAIHEAVYSVDIE